VTLNPTASSSASVRIFEPRAQDWRSVSWPTGVFDTARRPYTDKVEGIIQTPHHVVLVTLEGGAERLEVASACGHRYDGRERRGAVSFAPAHVERRLRLWGVRSRWASVALGPELFEEAAQDSRARGAGAPPGTFTNADDPFIAALVIEMERIHAADGSLDPTYCDAMASALAHHLVRRYGRAGEPPGRGAKLAPWQMRRIEDHVETHLEGEIRIADLAGAVGVSTSHLHRAFRAATGATPLAFVNQRRIQRAVWLLDRGRMSITEVALRVGFTSPSHFTRTFRRVTGHNPSVYRRPRNPP
jgi:AraC family transcriptional regulator